MKLGLMSVSWMLLGDTGYKYLLSVGERAKALAENETLEIYFSCNFLIYCFLLIVWIVSPELH